jgi:hypothetical protein
MRFALNAICATILMGCQPLAADYIFALDPVDGKVSGNLGQTIGWGYRLTNLSGTDWLMPTSLDAGLFSHSTPELWFGFPILPPGTEFTYRSIYSTHKACSLSHGIRVRRTDRPNKGSSFCRRSGGRGTRLAMALTSRALIQRRSRMRPGSGRLCRSQPRRRWPR